MTISRSRLPVTPLSGAPYVQTAKGVGSNVQIIVPGVIASTSESVGIENERHVVMRCDHCHGGKYDPDSPALQPLPCPRCTGTGELEAVIFTVYVRVLPGPAVADETASDVDQDRIRRLG